MTGKEKDEETPWTKHNTRYITTTKKAREEKEEEEDAVEAIKKFRKSRKKAAGGYELNVKWVGYSDKDNTWEPMAQLLDGWDCEGNDIYDFFESNGIDVSACSEFDFVTRKVKGKSSNVDTLAKELQKGNSNAKESTQKQDDQNEKSEVNEKESEGFICSKGHSAVGGNLKMEDNGSYASKGNFLHQKQCKKCKKEFVEKNEDEEDSKYVISQRTPCYLCENQLCTYYICGNCYKKELISSDSSGLSSRRNTHKK